MQPLLKACKVPLKSLPMLIDGFKFKSDEYRYYGLTHWHSDHYGGLNKNWKFGPIFATETTINLAVECLKIERNHFRTLFLNKRTEVDDTGVFLTALDANHCPGACMFLIERGATRILFTGDFRFTRADVNRATLNILSSVAPLNRLFIDTTYLAPKWEFPPQRQVLDELAAKALELAVPGRVFLVSTYKVGKEPVLFALSEALDTKVFVPEDKLRRLRCCYPGSRVTAHFTACEADAGSCRVHVAVGPMSFKTMTAQLRRAEDHGFRSIATVAATGWTFRAKSSGGLVKHQQHPASPDRIHMLSAPYSEHSSFTEVRALVSLTRPRHVQSIVDVGAGEAAKVRTVLGDCMDQTTDRSTIVPFLSSSRKVVTEVIDVCSQPVVSGAAIDVDVEEEEVIDID